MGEESIYRYWGVTDKGLRYELNEDKWKMFCYKDVLFLIVADGFGNREGINISSITAISEIQSFIERSLESDYPEHIKRAVSDATYLANRVLSTYKAADNKLYAGVGTSLTLCAVNQNKDIIIFHTGNTRLYIKRNNILTQFTKDYTEAQELYEQGKITKDELPLHPDRKKLTGALGFMGSKYELTPGKLQTDDLLVLCTDGVYEMLSNGEILSITNEASDLKTICEWFKEGALKRGGVDNLAAVVSVIKF